MIAKAPQRVMMATMPRDEERAGWLVNASTESLSVRRVDGFSAARDAAERMLSENGVVLPVPQLARWQRAHRTSDSVLLVVEDARSVVIGALSAAISWSRALPGHRIYRVERFASVSAAADAALAAELGRIARRDPLCLRLVVEIFEADADARNRLRAEIERQGFVRTGTSRRYTRTFAVDLHGTEEELYARLNKTVRKNVTLAAKKGLELRPITDPRFASRIASLVGEAFRRTNAVASARPWAQIILLSASNPQQSRILGLFDPKTDGEDSLVSVAWGCAHGPYATYEAGASVRRPDLKTVPLGFAPLWELIAWARRETAAGWFDLGGGPSAEDHDERPGITAFKRHFSDNLVEVGEEWQLEPHRVRSSLARTFAKWARGTTRLLARTPAGSHAAVH